MSDTLIAGGHTPATDWDGALTSLEARAEIDSLEDLHARRRSLLREYAPLRALHGPGGKWDARRKAMLEATKVQARMDMQKAGEKITESAVDTAGHAHENYIKFIEDGITSATRYVELETEISEIEERIKNRETVLYVFGQEMKLAR